MSKISTIDIKNAIISITKIEDEDYICLTDMRLIPIASYVFSHLSGLNGERSFPASVDLNGVIILSG